jgi:hypothetical protein
MNNIAIDNRTGRTISGTIRISAIDGEESCMMAFCNDDEGDIGTITFFESFASGTDSFDFCFDDMGELSFRNTVTEE